MRAENPEAQDFQLQTYDRIPLLCKAVRSRVPLHDDFVFEAERGASEVIPWLKRLLSLPERPTALLCADDQEAQRVVEIVRETGLKIPQDVSVMGMATPVCFRGLPPSAIPGFRRGARQWR
ncbi:MAG: substrate-binding domain-containing protein [Victivallales bacterium]